MADVIVESPSAFILLLEEEVGLATAVMRAMELFPKVTLQCAINHDVFKPDDWEQWVFSLSVWNGSSYRLLCTLSRSSNTASGVIEVRDRIESQQKFEIPLRVPAILDTIIAKAVAMFLAEAENSKRWAEVLGKISPSV